MEPSRMLSESRARRLCTLLPISGMTNMRLYHGDPHSSKIDGKLVMYEELLIGVLSKKAQDF